MVVYAIVGNHNRILKDILELLPQDSRTREPLIIPSFRRKPESRGSILLDPGLRRDDKSGTSQTFREKHIFSQSINILPRIRQQDNLWTFVLPCFHLQTLLCGAILCSPSPHPPSLRDIRSNRERTSIANVPTPSRSIRESTATGSMKATVPAPSSSPRTTTLQGPQADIGTRLQCLMGERRITGLPESCKGVDRSRAFQGCLHVDLGKNTESFLFSHRDDPLFYLVQITREGD